MSICDPCRRPPATNSRNPTQSAEAQEVREQNHLYEVAGQFATKMAETITMLAEAEREVTIDEETEDAIRFAILVAALEHYPPFEDERRTGAGYAPRST